MFFYALCTHSHWAAFIGPCVRSAQQTVQQMRDHGFDPSAKLLRYEAFAGNMGGEEAAFQVVEELIADAQDRASET